MVESGGLENRCTGNPGTEGSNPSPSAPVAGTFAIGGALNVHRLGFGAMRLPGIRGAPRAPGAAREILREAVRLGVDLIDTARAYGRSEDLIAEALHPYPDGLGDRHQGRAPPRRPPRRAPGAAARRLRGQPAAPSARHDRPLAAAPDRSRRPGRGAVRRHPRAPRRGQDPLRRRLGGLGRRAAPGARADRHRHGPEPLQRRRADRRRRARRCEEHGIGFLPWAPIAHGRPARPPAARSPPSPRVTARRRARWRSPGCSTARP